MSQDFSGTTERSIDTRAAWIGNHRRRVRATPWMTVACVLATTLAGARAQTSEAAVSPEPYATVIRGASVLDGSGAPARNVDVAVDAAGRIAAIGDLADAPARSTIDANGLTLAPGFIDGHAHADTTAARRGRAGNFLLMGVTTLVTGNCGSSVEDLQAHFAEVRKNGISLNYASLVGHGTVRRAVLGTANRAPTDEELAAMRNLVAEAMQAGAVGMSTGLIYVPGTYAETDELVALSEVVAEHGGVYASHMRNEGGRVLDSIEEALEIGRRSGVHVHLSHLKASGKTNWGRGEEIVAALAAAREAGRKVTGDQYAYAASSTGLEVLFPTSALAIGRGAFCTKLDEDEDFRAEMEKSLGRSASDGVNGGFGGFGDLHYAQIANAPGNRNLNGMRLDEAAQELYGKNDLEAQIDAAIDIMIASKGRRVQMVYHKMSEVDVERIMREPYIAVAADAGIRLHKSESRPHPRGAGNNPRVLGRYVRDRKVLPLSLAIKKMTSLPAEVFGLEDRGMIRVGAWADFVLFDPAKIADGATYDSPLEAPQGIHRVVVNGVTVVLDGEHTGARPGHVLPHGRPLLD